MHAAASFRRKRLLKLWMAVGIALTTAFFLTIASPARAESGTGLPNGAGHTCQKLGDDGVQTAVLCLDLGIYTSSSGAQAVTAQVEVLCGDDSDGGVLGPCLAAQAEATIAAPGWTDWTTKSCNNVPCDDYGPTGRTFLFPFGGLSISPGYCYNEVWASVMGASAFSPTWIQFADAYDFTEHLGANFATPHYKVCESDSGQFTWTG